jgi:hypothetical protein
MADTDQIDDLAVWVRNATDQELRAYGESFGRDSREWMVAEQELERRRFPLWARIGQFALLAPVLWHFGRRLF